MKGSFPSWMIAGCLAASVPSVTYAQSIGVPDDIDRAELIERAKEEGSVTWYVSVPTPGSQAAAEAFMELYPEIQVDVQRLGGFGQIGSASGRGRGCQEV